MKHRMLLIALTAFISLGATAMRTETEAAPAAHGTLAERLGFQPTDKILIINGDDAGLSHAASAATIDALEHGLMTSATIMMPCPWVPEIAAYARSHPQADFGLHLTHTSEWRKYRWGPVANRSEVRGLLDPEGYLWETIKDVYRHASPRQAEIEARAQIKKALAMGIDVTHLDSHMGALQYDLRYYKVYRKLALEFNVPIRMASQEMLEAAGAGHLREQLERDGIVFTDYLIHGQRKAGEPVADYWKRMLNNLQPGVTELYIHAALPADEMKEITGSWADRAEEYRLFTKEPEIRQLLETHKIKRIGYRALRDLQRKQRTNR